VSPRSWWDSLWLEIRKLGMERDMGARVRRQAGRPSLRSGAEKARAEQCEESGEAQQRHGGERHRLEAAAG
jgi:hypothetical protein